MRKNLAKMQTLFCTAALAAGVATTNAGAPNPAAFPMEECELATTQFGGHLQPGNPQAGPDPAGRVAAVYDTRLPPVGANPVPVPGTIWPAPEFHNQFAPTTPQDVWIARNIGQVFGLAIEDNLPNPSLYVTATTVYGDMSPWPLPQGGLGAGGPAGVYKLEGNTGDVQTFMITGFGGIGTNELPNTGTPGSPTPPPGLGQICYDKAHDQFFISNFDDGKIYRVDNNGIIQSIHDPFCPDNGQPSFCPLGERVWAVQVHNDRLYFSVWLKNDGSAQTPWNPCAGNPPAPYANNSIWSMPLNTVTGDFAGPEVLEIVMPEFNPGSRYSNPVSDIAFSDNGKMLLAEHTMNGDVGIIDLGHRARVLEYCFDAAAAGWVPVVGKDYYVGNLIGSLGVPTNSAGGIDYDCDLNVWATGDVLLPSGMYGAQRIPAAGNTAPPHINNSLFIDFMTFKGGPGDVEYYKIECGDDPPCPPTDLMLNIATGVNDDDGTLIPIGDNDDTWTLTSEPPPVGTLPRPPIVINPNPAWNTIPGTGWISGNQFGPNGEYVYEFCFCLDERFFDPQLFIELYADDQAHVFLNGNPIGSTPSPGFNTPMPTQLSVAQPGLFHVGENCIEVIVENQFGVVTGLNLAATVSARDGECCCEPEDLSRAVDTGVADTGGLIAVGDDDDSWTVTCDASGGATPRPATVINPNSAWNTIPGTQWISADTTGPNGTYCYEYCFCLEPGYSNPLVDINLRADDQVDVFLNGNLIGSLPNGTFNDPSPTNVMTTDPDFFNDGENCIELRVQNLFGVVTGVNAQVLVEATEGLCCDDRDPVDPQDEPCIRPPVRMTAWYPLDEAGPATANEIVVGNDGAHNGVVPGVPGMVSLAAEFDGIDDRIVAPSAPQNNIGASIGSLPGSGDFTIDAWINGDGGSGTNWRPIVDKRSFNEQGYTFFLDNGQLGLWMGDGTGHDLYCCNPPFMAAGIWYHVAVTVDRDNPNGVVFYINGVPTGTTYNPTGRTGSLVNDFDLNIGATNYEEFPGTAPQYFRGRLDEIEIFKRVLSPTEIFDLYNAGEAGKCKDTCHVPWDKPFCLNQDQITAGLELCNFSTVPYTFNLSFAPVLAPTCPIDGPTVINPVGGSLVTVPPMTCQTVTLQIDRPVGMTAAGQIGCYDVLIDNLTTGQSFSCRGSVVDRRDLCAVLDPIDVDVVAVPFGLPPQPIVWQLTNTTQLPLDLPLQIVPMGPDMQPAGNVSLDGLPPGEPVVRTVKLPPQGVAPIEFTARIIDHEPFVFYDIILMVDFDGDGNPESPISSVALRSVLDDGGLLGDMNCDGVVSVGDIGAFVLALTDPAGYAAQFPDCDINNGDINGDGIVSVGDIGAFVALLTGG